MPYINDQQTLAQVVSPVDAAAQMGIQNSIANQEAQTKQDILQQQAPDLAQQPGLENLFKKAQTGYEQGMGMQSQAKGLVDMAAAPSGAEAQIAGNQLKLTTDQAQKLTTVGQMAGQIAGIMDGVPAPARPAMMQQIMAQYHLNPETLGPLASGDPDMLRNVSQKMIQASSGFQQTMAEKELENQGRENVANITSAGRVQSAETMANARIQAAEIQRQARQQALNFEQLAAQRYAAGDLKGAEQLRQAAASVRQLAAQTTQTLVGVQPQFGGFDQGQPSPQGGPQQAPALANQPTQPLQGNAVQSAAVSAFGKYEPDKYEYGINPATGNFGRRLKGK